MASSYNGWTASPYPARIGIVHFEPIPGYDFPGGIKNGDVKVIFTYLVRQLHSRVEPIVIYPPGDEWGYAYRDNVNRPGQLSCHASGTAIDYNATEHPNRIKYTWTRAQAREIHKIIDDELDGVIKWLEGWDEMHFEIRGTVAQVRAVADKIRNGTVSGPNPIPEPEPEPVPTPTPEPEPQEIPVYKITWIKGRNKPGKRYRVLYALGKNGDLVPVEAYNIDSEDPKTLARWQARLEEVPATKPLPANTFIRIMDGPYKNVA